MIKRVELRLGNGFFDIVYGDSFGIECDDAPFLCYEENSIWYVQSSPDVGKSCTAVITLQKGAVLESLLIKLYDGSAKVCEINSGTVDVEIRNARAEFGSIKARRINAVLGKGSAVINAQVSVSADFDCGFGDMSVNLKKGNYRIKSVRGNGRVSINSSAVPRDFESGDCSGIKLNLRCGLGKLDVNFM